MKYIKIFALMVGILGFTACSDYDSTPETPDTNTASGVTVSMKQADIIFMESKGIVRVPVVVDGTPNGYVTVTCTVEEYVDGNQEYDPAIDLAHYLLTSPTINIADGDKSGYFEVKLLDDRVINPDRRFKLTLVEAQGATIGSINSTIVNIEDNDDRPYDRLDGAWYMYYKSDPGDERYQTRQVTLSTWNLDHWAYGYSYQLWGIVGDNNPYDEDATESDKLNSGAYPALVMFNYNESTDEGSLTIKLGQTIGQIELPDGSKTAVFLYAVTEDYGIQDSGTVTLTWNEAGDELYVTSSPMGDYINLAGLYQYNRSWYIADNICWGINKFSRDR